MNNHFTINFSTIAFLCIIIIIIFSAVDAKPECTSARAQNSYVSSSQCGFGKSSDTTGIKSPYLAGLDQLHFAEGAQCGACWKLTGPAGSVVVTVVDVCSNQSQLCQGDVPHFVVNDEAFAQISSDTNPNDVLLYDIAATPVPCSVTGPLGLKVTGSNTYSINTLAFNFDTPLDSLELMADKWLSPVTLKRQPLTSTFQWQASSNQQANPPLIFTANANTGESISLTIQGSILGENYLSFPTNFDVSSTPNLTCNAFAPSGDIYHDKLMGYGWQYFQSNDVSPDFVDSEEPDQGPTSLKIIMNSGSYFLASRNGGFFLGPVYKDLTFAARLDSSSVPSTMTLLTFVDLPVLPTPLIDFTVTTEWQTYTIPFITYSSEINGDTLFTGIGWENNGTDTVILFLDNVALVDSADPSTFPDFSSVNTLPTVPQTSTTTTTTTSRFDDTTTTAASTTSTMASDASSSSSSICVICIILLAIVFST